MSAQLIHVGVHESSARRFLPGEDMTEWLGADAEDPGTMQIVPWAEEQTMVFLSVRMAGDSHAVRVTIGALYDFSNGTTMPTGQGDGAAFYRHHIAEMVPLLRQAVHSASSQVWPIKPIMLDALTMTRDDAVEAAVESLMHR